MKSEPRIRLAVLLVLACPTAAWSGLAAIQTSSAAYGTQASPLSIGDSLVLSLNKFDSSLGTLTGATLRLSSHANVESQVLNFSRLAQQYSAATATVPISVTALGGLTFSTTPTAGPFSGTVPGPQFTVVSAGSAAVFSVNTANVALPDLILYQGLGTQSLDVSVGLASGIYSGVSLGPVFFGGQGSAYGTVEIEYTYSAVPESETLLSGVFLTAYVGFGLFRQRRAAQA